MGLHQFANSLHQIATNHHVSTVCGFAKHLKWQVRKTFNLFPFEQCISSSRIVATHKACSVSALIYSQGLYDYNNMHFVRWLLRDGGIFFDIGANIGSYSLVASEQEMAQVFAFEPHPETFSHLASNLALNRRDNVCAVNMALGQHEGTVRFTNQPSSSTNHLLDHPDPGSISVSCRRADSYCREKDVQPQFVKLDVEGYEHDVLLSFGSYLERIEVLLIEMNGLSDQRGAGRQEIHTLLCSAGLQGPWRCDFDRRALCRQVNAWREDSLYISSHSRLRLAGWVVD